MKVAVIGGGIVGGTASFYLKKAGLDVTLFDEGTGQATKAAAGIVSPWLSQRRNQNWYQLAKLGAAFYPQLIQDLDLPSQSDVYHRVGAILFKKNEDLLKKLTKLAHQRKEDAPEIGEIALLSAAEIQQRMPLIAPTEAGLFVSGGAKVDGEKLVTTLQERFQALGGRFIPTHVTALAAAESGWTLRFGTQEESFDKVILATGAWLPQLLEPLGFQVDVRPQKGQLLELKLDYETADWPVIMPQGEGDIIPFTAGRVLVGASHENDQGFDLAVDDAVLQNLVASLVYLAPEIEHADIVKERVGTRAYTSDFLPFFGEVKELPGIFVASGLGSSGLTTGPLIAHTLAAWLQDQETQLAAVNYAPDAYIHKL